MHERVKASVDSSFKKLFYVFILALFMMNLQKIENK